MQLYSVHGSHERPLVQPVEPRLRHHQMAAAVIPIHSLAPSGNGFVVTITSLLTPIVCPFTAHFLFFLFLLGFDILSPILIPCTSILPAR